MRRRAASRLGTQQGARRGPPNRAADARASHGTRTLWGPGARRPAGLPLSGLTRAAWRMHRARDSAHAGPGAPVRTHARERRRPSASSAHAPGQAATAPEPLPGPGAGRGRAAGMRRQDPVPGSQGHSLLLAVREVQVHLELEADLAQRLFHLRERQSARDLGASSPVQWKARLRFPRAEQRHLRDLRPKLNAPGNLDYTFGRRKQFTWSNLGKV